MWIMDFEASGLSPLSYPIEVGLTNKNIHYQTLIYPMKHWTHWCTKAQDVHSISENQLLQKGKKSIDVARELNTLIDKDTVYCDSVWWDRFWCNVLFSDNGIHQNFEIRDIKEILMTSEPLMVSYINAKTVLEKSGDFRVHRALDDAKIIHASLKEAMICSGSGLT